MTGRRGERRGLRWRLRTLVGVAWLALAAAACVPAADSGAFPSPGNLPTVPTPPIIEATTRLGDGLPSSADEGGPPVRAASLERQARRMTVRIRSSGCGALGTGSGFAIGDGIIVTNRHVVERASMVSLNTWDGQLLHATLLGADYSDDVALVRIAADFPSAGQLAESDPLEGSAVTVVGFPLGGEQRLTEGEVVDYARLDSRDGPRVLRLSAEIWPGSSGGPVLDAHGRVVGVVFAIERATGYALAVPVSELQDVLDDGAEAVEATCS